jgi:dUTP pyrophosphatase
MPPGRIKQKEKHDMRICIRKVSETAIIPTRGSSEAAGYDLYADVKEDTVLEPGETKLIDTGLQIEIPEGYFAGIFARSGLATREGLRPANCVGVCDSDYRGNYLICMHNDSSVPRVITPHEKIAQMIVLPYLQLEFEETTGDLSETSRGEAGFGSTGK